MPRKPTKTLTEAEQRVMEVLWRLGEASVRNVADALSKEKPVAYNTVQTILGILHRKNYVKYRRDGRAHLYRTTVSQTRARQEAFEHLIRQFFGGSKNAFAQYLVDEEKIDPEELKRLRALAERTIGKKT